MHSNSSVFCNSKLIACESATKKNMQVTQLSTIFLRCTSVCFKVIYQRKNTFQTILLIHFSNILSTFLRISQTLGESVYCDVTMIYQDMSFCRPTLTSVSGVYLLIQGMTSEFLYIVKPHAPMQ